MSTCRSCGANILWAVTTNGMRIPVDAAPNPTGNLFLRKELDGQLRAVLLGTEVHFPDVVRHVSHFVTCPEGKQWRKAR